MFHFIGWDLNFQCILQQFAFEISQSIKNLCSSRVFSFAFTEDNLCLGKEIQIAIVQSSNEHFRVVKSFVSLPSMSGVRWRNKFVGFELKNQRCARSLKSNLSHRDVASRTCTCRRGTWPSTWGSVTQSSMNMTTQTNTTRQSDYSAPWAVYKQYHDQFCYNSVARHLIKTVVVVAIRALTIWPHLDATNCFLMSVHSRFCCHRAVDSRFQAAMHRRQFSMMIPVLIMHICGAWGRGGGGSPQSLLYLLGKLSSQFVHIVVRWHQ